MPAASKTIISKGIRSKLMRTVFGSFGALAYGPPTEIEILTRSGDTILTRDGSTVIARAS